MIHTEQIHTAADYLQKHAERAAHFPPEPVLPRTTFYFDDGTPQYAYFKTPPRVGEPLKCALRFAMVNTVTGERAIMVELTDAQIERMQNAIANR